MRLFVPSLLGFLLLAPAVVPAQPIRDMPPQAVPDLQATYQVYAAGFHVAEVQATFSIGRRHYHLQLAYHTTGIVGFFRRGHQFDEVIGTWVAGQPHPEAFTATGVWDGEQGVTRLLYRHDDPVVMRLVPPVEKERQPVPEALQQHSVDSLSAIALLIRRVQDTGRCEASVHTFDGRRASEISATTAGEQMLQHSDQSIYEGKALRCDFAGRMLAGFRFGEDAPENRRPLHGAAWLAPLQAGGPPLPVLMQFETRWFGEARMYLTHLQAASPQAVAQH